MWVDTLANLRPLTGNIAILEGYSSVDDGGGGIVVNGTLIGTGTVNGRRCEWSVDILEAKKTVLILSYWAPGLADRHASEGIQFINSIKLTK